MSLQLSVNIGPYVKCETPPYGMKPIDIVSEGFEDLYLHNFNHRKQTDNECWIPNKPVKHTLLRYSDELTLLIDNREAGEVCLDDLDMDKECDAFEECYCDGIEYLKTCGRSIEICYGLLVSYD